MAPGAKDEPEQRYRVQETVSGTFELCHVLEMHRAAWS